MKLDSNTRRVLLDTAWQVIHAGVSTGTRPGFAPDLFPADLQDMRATFITLTRDSKLRGCCGTVEAHQTLIDDVIENTWRTAFSDPRFEPLSEPEYAGLLLEISVLSPLQQIEADSRQQLLSQVKPGHHGLLICRGRARATFLPKVWESLPAPEIFLQQLQAKAGMSLDQWPEQMEAFVYTSEIFGEQNPT